MTPQGRADVAAAAGALPGAVSPPRPVSGLAREITIILALKIGVLCAIWFAWFSAPQARHLPMPPERVTQHLIEAPEGHAKRSLQSAAAGDQEHAAH
jgi:hypothetical protein